MKKDNSKSKNELCQSVSNRSSRAIEAEMLQDEIDRIVNDNPEEHPKGAIVTVSVGKTLFIEMARCFIHKHGV